MGWQPLPDDAPLDGFTPLPEGAQLDATAPDGSGFNDDQKRQIQDYIPKAKDAADLEKFSMEISGGKSKIGNAQSVLDAMQKGHRAEDFAWTPPTVSKDMARTPPSSAGKAFTEHVANALAFDYGPEVGGFIDTIIHPGSELKNNIAHERAMLSGDSEGHGVASALGEIGGIAAGAPLLGAGELAALGRGAGYAVEHGSQAANLARTAAEGAAYGSGAAGPGDRVEGAATGAILAPVIGAAIKAPLAAIDAGRTVLQGSPGLARRIVAKAIRADENTPASAGADMTAGHANDVPMMLADTGENARGLLAAAGRTSGPARTITRDALETRQAGLADRVTGAIERDLGPVANPHEIADSLLTKARTEAAPLYDSFYSKAPVSSPAIDAMVQRPSMQKALKNAYRIAQEEGRDPEALGLRMGEDGSVQAEPVAAAAETASAQVTDPRTSLSKTASWILRNKETGEVIGETFSAKHVAALNTSKYEAIPIHDYLGSINGRQATQGAAQAAPKAAATAAKAPEQAMTYTPQTLDYIKRGMDDVVEGYKDPVTGRYNFDTEGRAVNNTLRSYLKVVDSQYPDYAAARSAYGGPVSGINAMNTGRKALNMTADDLEARMRNMSPFEKQMFALGARRAMAETISSKGDTANVINAITGTGKKRAMLARLFGDRPTFNRFVQTLNQEKEGFRTYARALSGSPTALNLEDDATLKFASVAADMAANGGIPVATAVRQAVKFGIGKIGDKTKQQVAALLSETDPARFKELAAQLREEATRRGLFKRKVNIVTGGVGKSAVAIGGQQSQ